MAVHLVHKRGEQRSPPTFGSDNVARRGTMLGLQGACQQLPNVARVR